MTQELVVENVLQTAKHYSKVDVWKRHKRDKTGAVIGQEEIKAKYGSGILSGILYNKQIRNLHHSTVIVIQRT